MSDRLRCCAGWRTRRCAARITSGPTSSPDAWVRSRRRRDASSTADMPATILRVRRGIALVAMPIAFLLVHGALPWGISLLSAVHGWVDGRPGALNRAAAGVVIAGGAGVVWGIVLHLRGMGETFEMPASIDPEYAPGYLLSGGPYRYSRNPMYVCVMTMWLGWTLFYGS